MQLFLGLLHESIVVFEVSIIVSGTLCIDIIGDLRKLGDIFVTEIDFCRRFFLTFEATSSYK